MIVQGRLKGHQSVSSAGISPVQFGAKQAASKHSKLPGGIGWLREVRHLQDPNPRLHNMPEASTLAVAGVGCHTNITSGFWTDNPVPWMFCCLMQLWGVVGVICKKYTCMLFMCVCVCVCEHACLKLEHFPCGAAVCRPAVPIELHCP